MLLKNNYPFRFYALGQFLGVFLTAFVVTALFHQQSMLYGLPISGNTWWLSLGLFCSIMLIYSVDHIRDIKVLLASKKNNEKLVLGYKIIVIITLSIIGYLGVVHFKSMLNLKLLLVPVIGCLFYVLERQLKQYYTRGLKELLISLIVAFTMMLPFLYHTSIEGVFVNMFRMNILIILNLLIFAYFEKEKDDALGFRTVLFRFNMQKSYNFILILSVLFNTIILGVFIATGTGLGFVLASISYLIMLLGHKWFQQNGIYRFVADALLLLLLI